MKKFVLFAVAAVLVINVAQATDEDKKRVRVRMEFRLCSQSWTSHQSSRKRLMSLTRHTRRNVIKRASSRGMPARPS